MRVGFNLVSFYHNESRLLVVKNSHDFPLPAGQGGEEGCPAVLGFEVRLGVAYQKQFRQLTVARQRRHVQRSPSFIILGVGVGPAPEEKASQIYPVEMGGRHMQRRFSFLGWLDYANETGSSRR